ncbi:hypothetical protein ACFWEB_36670 [Streptomyces parvus]|uniref:hypothetical protein n=1 Tax=Streptomyces parvus TaxID=66428 RepID=UPI003661CF0A
MALSGVRLQELKHLLVGAAAGTSEGVADLYGQVQIAQGQGVSCAEGALQVLGSGPGADARDEPEPGRRLR